VRAKAPGYLDWTGVIGADEKATEATITLQPVPPHPVRLTGLPAQAKVQVADQTVTADATGTALVELRPGQVTLTASAAKYEPLEHTVDIQADTESVPLVMKTPAPAGGGRGDLARWHGAEIPAGAGRQFSGRFAAG
jgi:hypothetical protein